MKTQMNAQPNAGESGIDIEKINRFSRRTLDESEVYTFAVVLCDNEIDRDFERFDTDALKTLSEMFLGKTGIFDHSMRSGDQTSRIYDTQLIIDSERKNSLGEPYAYVRAMAYMPRTEKNADLIDEIDAGIKKEASVGCAVSSIVCSMCATELKTGICEHIKGKSYGGKVCHHILRMPTDAYEWSLVAVPAQKAAGITKAFKHKEEKQLDDILKTVMDGGGEVTLHEADVLSLRKAIGELENRAAQAEGYRAGLADETVRMGLLALKGIDGECLRKICNSLGTDELCELKKAFADSAGKNIPLDIQLRVDSGVTAENNEFKI